MEPVFNCLNKQRIGGDGLGDGPKFFCEPMTVASKPDCLIYSIGSNGDFKYEDYWAKLSNNTCEIHTFDFGEYERPGDKTEKNIHYHRVGLGSSEQAKSRYSVVDSNPNATIWTFNQIIKELGHKDRTIDVLKIDCEGCEWETFPDFTNKNIGQINIEVHGLGLGDRHMVYEMFDAFRANHYAMYSKEFNVMTPIGPGSLVEFSFIQLHPDFWNMKHTY